jgi:four helix bundle protein
MGVGSCLAFTFCLLGRAASRPRPALRAGERLLARALSLDPARPSTRGMGQACGFCALERVNVMLRIYPVVLEVLKQLRPVMRRIELRDKDLARQLRRCSVSVALNIAEGMYSRGGNRTARYHSALGSARETLACLEAAEACGYVGATEVALTEQLKRVVGTLVKLVAA